MAELEPNIFAVTTAGSNILQVLDKNKMAVTEKISLLNKEIYGIK